MEIRGDFCKSQYYVIKYRKYCKILQEKVYIIVYRVMDLMPKGIFKMIFRLKT